MDYREERIIAHIDMDAFFASVEERANSDVRGKPVVVGADPKGGNGRGVVSTANYKARAYGIHSAQPIARAWRFSEEARKKGSESAIFLPVDFLLYGRVSKHLMEILHSYSGAMEEASIDEAYLDISFVWNYKKAENLARKIKEKIKYEEGITASIGIGQNKLIAKVASGMEKPDGLTVVLPERVQPFLAPLPIREIPGIGPKTAEMLYGKKIFLVQDLRKISEAELYEWLGEWGLSLYEKARGLDTSPVCEGEEIKTIGEQETFEEDTLSPRLLSERLYAMCKNVLGSLSHGGFQTFRTVTITVRFSDFRTFTRSHTMKSPAAKEDVLRIEALKLLLQFLDKRENPDKMQIRLLGVRIEKLA